MKRILLFIATNALVVITISVVLRVLGVGNYLNAHGIDYTSLAIFCLVWGCVGSFISLLLSKTMAKWMMGVQIVQQTDPRFGSLVTMVERLSMKAGLPTTPEVGVYESPEVNAFATGPSKRNALVAFSTGLLQQMDRDEIEGVAAHEIAHIQNGDMVTMALLQGVINAFVMFLARVIGYAVAQNSQEENRRSTMMWVTFVAEILLTFLGMMVVAGFSRWREFRADSGAGNYAGREKMIAALERLKVRGRLVDEQPAMATFKIHGQMGRLFSSHPPLEDRINALRRASAH